MSKPVKYITLGKINEPIYMLGFKPLQLALLFFSLIIVTILSIVLMGVYVAVFVVVFYIGVVVKIGEKIAKNNQLGNPDYLESELSYKAISKEMEDENCVCNLLLKNE